MSETREMLDETNEEKKELLIQLEQLRITYSKEKSDHNETKRILGLWQKKYEAADAQKETIKALNKDKEEIKK